MLITTMTQFYNTLTRIACNRLVKGTTEAESHTAAVASSCRDVREETDQRDALL